MQEPNYLKLENIVVDDNILQKDYEKNLLNFHGSPNEFLKTFATITMDILNDIVNNDNDENWVSNVYHALFKTKSRIFVILIDVILIFIFLKISK